MVLLADLGLQQRRARGVTARWAHTAATMFKSGLKIMGSEYDESLSFTCDPSTHVQGSQGTCGRLFYVNVSRDFFLKDLLG